MYVHRNHKIIYLAHPRTASKATAATLKEEYGFESIRGHHENPETVHRDWEEKVLRECGPRSWSVFSTVRNPFEVMAGWYYNTNYRGVSWGVEYLEEIVEKMSPQYFDTPTKPFYRMFLHLPFCNHVLRYENLQKDFDEFMESRGLEPITLQRKNVTESKNKTYKELFGEEEREWMIDRFEIEMKTLGYRW